jgi:hypothetical protein
MIFHSWRDQDTALLPVVARYNASYNAGPCRRFPQKGA